MSSTRPIFEGTPRRNQIWDTGPGVRYGPCVRDGPRAGHFYATFVTDDTLVADSFVFSTVAFPVLGRSENLFGKQSVLFRFLRTVVDGFRLRDFAIRPLVDIVRRCDLQTDGVEVDRFDWFSDGIAPSLWLVDEVVPFLSVSFALVFVFLSLLSLCPFLVPFSPSDSIPFLACFLARSSTSRPRPFISRTRTLKDSGTLISLSAHP